MPNTDTSKSFLRNREGVSDRECNEIQSAVMLTLIPIPKIGTHLFGFVCNEMGIYLQLVVTHARTHF